MKKLKLDDRPPFKDHRDAAGLFMSKVQVEAVPETFVVEVRVTDPDPQQAALWANTLGDLYIDYSIEGQVESARRAYRWVTERLAETQTSMQDAQNKLLKSYQGQDLFVPEGSVSAITTSITKLNDDLVQTQARKITLQSQLAEFSGSRQRGRELDAVPQVAADADRARPERQAPGAEPGAAAPQGEVQGGPPRGAEGPGPDRPPPKGHGRPGSSRSRTGCGPSTGSSSGARPS